MLEKELVVAVKAARAAGKVSLKYFGKNFYVKKKGKIDLVTQADIECEKKIREIISKSFPKDSFLQEESGQSVGSSKRTWVIDPIDGTTNFAHSIPWFATSIALMEGEKVLFGVCFNPLSKELYTARIGRGAFLNGKKISVSKNRDLIDCVLATGFPYEGGRLADLTIKSMSNLVGHAQGVRRFGSAVLDLCFVARGSFDGFFEYKLNAWDVAAAGLVVHEAGGVMTDFSGKHASPYAGSFVASNSLVHNDLLLRLVKP